MNLETLNKYYDDGLLYKQTHPSLPLTIWNYTEKVQYEMLWDDVTVQCRGLITENTTGKILVRPFKKFFNYEEVVGKNLIPTKGDYVYIQEKMDGSLGILFNYEGEWIMATRGSFTSEQAIKGLEIVKSNYFLKSWLTQYVYLVEIIYPDNRIVVDYKGKERVVFLSVVINEGFSGWQPTDEPELHWVTANSILSCVGVPNKDIVKTEQHFNFSDDLYRSLKEKNKTNKEGFVLKFFPSNFRMKIKFEDYVRLHKIMTNFSTRNVWETLSNGEDLIASLVDVPDEFYDKIKNYSDELKSQFETLEREYKWIFKILNRSIIEVYNVPKEKQRAVFAQYAKNYKHPSLLFNMLDDKDYTKIIWKLIEPEYKKL